MKRSRFSEEQFVGVLNEHHAGIAAVGLCRKLAPCDAPSYTW